MDEEDGGRSTQREQDKNQVGRRNIRGHDPKVPRGEEELRLSDHHRPGALQQGNDPPCPVMDSLRLARSNPRSERQRGQ